MKRYISFDFMKGVGIVGVVCFHVLNVAFEKEANEIRDGNAAIPLLILAVVLIYLGSFNGMFVCPIALTDAINTNTVINNNRFLDLFFIKLPFKYLYFLLNLIYTQFLLLPP